MAVDIEDAKSKNVYDFDEAINLTGTGWYNIALMATLSLALLAMCIDMFSFSVVVQLNSCDFQLNLMQKSILVSLPFVGPVLTAYVWGYISDTKGRRLSLIVGMAVSFVFSTLCAFSTHWIIFGLLKMISTCFCSCAQSATFTLLGESCPVEKKAKYLLILSSVTHLGMSLYFTLSYLIGILEFSFDIGLVTFVPWRLLVIVLALPLGITVICLMFFYESPKFLLNVGKEKDALEVLRNIHRRNCRDYEDFPVNKVVLNEKGNVDTKAKPLLQSLREQTLPLFKPPLLFNTLLLYTFIIIVYSVSGSLYIWLPFLANAFSIGSNSDFSNGLCGVISKNNSISSNSATDTCRPFDVPVVIASLISGTTYSLLNLFMSKAASKRRLVILLIFGGASISCFLNTVIPNQGSGIAYLGVLSTSLAMGPLFSYYVDLYPTSFRGMATCLAVMVARISSVLGINLVGLYITSHCINTFYVLSSLLLGAGLLTFLLPPDKTNKITQ